MTAPEALSPADRLRARIQGHATTPAFDGRPVWLKTLGHYEDIGPDSTESRTHEFAEHLIRLHDGGHYVPGELLIMARAYLQPKHYRADRDRARTHDPATSQKAANNEKRPRRARTQAHELLKAFANVNRNAGAAAPVAPYWGGLTAPEAALIIGKPGAWRRTPELHRDGLVEPIPWSEYAGPIPDELVESTRQFPEMPATRETVYGQQARVFRITELGRDELRRMNADERAYDRQKAAREGARGRRA